MTHHGNDRWSGAFADRAGQYVYAIEAWTDEFATSRTGSNASSCPAAA